MCNTGAGVYNFFSISLSNCLYKKGCKQFFPHSFVNNCLKKGKVFYPQIHIPYY